MYAQNLPFHNLKCTNFHVLYTIYKYVLYYIFVFWFRFVVDDVVVRVVYTQNRYISIHDSWSRVRRVKSRDETKRAELREEQRRDRRGNAQMRRAETRRKGAEQRRGAKAQRRRAAEVETGRVPCEARYYILAESTPSRVRVVAIAMCTQPRRGAYLAPLTPLIRAAHARDCTTRARTQHRLRGAQRTCSARERAT